SGFRRAAGEEWIRRAGSRPSASTSDSLLFSTAAPPPARQEHTPSHGTSRISQYLPRSGSPGTHSTTRGTLAFLVSMLRRSSHSLLKLGSPTEHRSPSSFKHCLSLPLFSQFTSHGYGGRRIRAEIASRHC